MRNFDQDVISFRVVRPEDCAIADPPGIAAS
jgi:hypothetical protein